MITGDYKCKNCNSGDFELLQESYKSAWAGDLLERPFLRCGGCRQKFDIGIINTEGLKLKRKFN